MDLTSVFRSVWFHEQEAVDHPWLSGRKLIIPNFCRPDCHRTLQSLQTGDDTAATVSEECMPITAL